MNREMGDLFPLRGPYKIDDDVIDRHIDHVTAVYYIAGSIDPDGVFRAGHIGWSLYGRHAILQLSKDGWTHYVAGPVIGQTTGMIYDWECRAFHEFATLQDHPVPGPLWWNSHEALKEWKCPVCGTEPNELRVLGTRDAPRNDVALITRDDLQQLRAEGGLG